MGREEAPPGLAEACTQEERHLSRVLCGAICPWTGVGGAPPAAHPAWGPVQHYLILRLVPEEWALPRTSQLHVSHAHPRGAYTAPGAETQPWGPSQPAG